MRLSRIQVIAFAAAALATHGRPAEACLRVGPVSPDAMVDGAALIVRAVATDYVIPAVGQRFRQGFSAGTVRFTIVETIRGAEEGEAVVLPGLLTERDDFNDHGAPYTFVRPEGRGGDCFASTYRRGAQFLLFLSRSGGTLALYSEPLGPVNEQLRGVDDLWLLWVRAAQQRLGPPNTRVKPAASASGAFGVTYGRRGLRAVR